MACCSLFSTFLGEKADSYSAEGLVRELWIGRTVQAPFAPSLA